MSFFNTGILVLVLILSTGNVWAELNKNSSYVPSCQEGESAKAYERAKYRRAKGFLSVAPIEMSDGTVIVVSEAGLIYFLNPNGTLKIKYDTGGVIFASPAVLDDGTVVVGVGHEEGLEKAHIYFLKLNEEGTAVELKAQYEMRAYILTSPVVLSDGTVVVADLYETIYFLTFDGTNIEVKAEYETNGSTLSLERMSDDTVVVKSWDEYIYFIKLNSVGDSVELRGKYRINTTSGNTFSSVAIMGDDTVVVGSKNGLLYFFNFNPNDDSLQLKANFDLGAPVIASPGVVNDGTVVIGSGKIIYFLSLDSDGNVGVRAKHRVRAKVNAKPAGMSDNTVVVSTINGFFYFFDSNGSFKARFKRKRAYFSTPTVLSDDTVAVGSTRNRFRILPKSFVHFLKLRCR